MRHESQAAVIANLRKVIAAIERLPEEAQICSANAEDGECLGKSCSIHMVGNSFATTFAGRKVERFSGGTLGEIIIDGTKYFGPIHETRFLDGPYVMPALETAKGGAS